MRHRTAPHEIDRALMELRGWYDEIPRLALTIEEASQLVALDPRLCLALLDALVDSRLLARTTSGAYTRRIPSRPSGTASAPASAERVPSTPGATPRMH